MSKYEVLNFPSSKTVCTGYVGFLRGHAKYKKSFFKTEEGRTFKEFN